MGQFRLALKFPLIVSSYGIEETKRIVSEFDFKSELLESLLKGLKIMEEELSASSVLPIPPLLLSSTP